MWWVPVAVLVALILLIPTGAVVLSVMGSWADSNAKGRK